LTLNLAEASVVKSQPFVPHGANLFTCVICTVNSVQLVLFGCCLD